MQFILPTVHSSYLILFTKYTIKPNYVENCFVASESEGNTITVAGVVVVDVAVVVDIAEVRSTVS